MNYDDYVVRSLQARKEQEMLRLEREAMEEVAEFVKLEKFVNPITGEKGQKVSSKQLKRLWIALKQVLNEVIAS